MAVVAKGKQRRSERQEDKELEGKVVAREKPSQRVTDSNVRGRDVQAVVAETLARVRADLYPSSETHDEFGNVTLEITEEAYIIMLTMVTGNNEFTPRRGLKIREAEISDTAKFCEEHK